MGDMTEPVHLIADGEAVTSCCGRTPFELPRTDRMTVDQALATCTGYLFERLYDRGETSAFAVCMASFVGSNWRP